MAHIEKEYMLEEVNRSLKDNSGLIIANFTNLSVVDIDDLRKKLRKSKSRLLVTKNTLLKKALEKHNYNGVSQFLEGPTGLALYREDPVSVAKTLFDFSKDHETFKVRGGIVDGEVLSESGAEELSKLPSKDVLRATVVMRLNAPISGLVNVLAGSLRGLVNVLDQVRKQKSE